MRFLPIINIQILEGRTEDQIKALIENVTGAVVQSLNAPQENVRVIVTEVNKTHWGIGGVSAKEIGR